MITIVNYGLGNIKAFANVYKRLNIPFDIANEAKTLKKATKIILPGVGSFDHAMNLLNQSGMKEVLNELVLNKKLPVLGICVGMQILANSSEEGCLSGLGWINGNVKKLSPQKDNKKLLLPHMGWNNITPYSSNKIFTNLNSDSRFYFLHSYYFHCSNEDNQISNTEYEIRFASAVNNENIYGVQFHPEKSHSNGIQLLKNFASL